MSYYLEEYDIIKVCTFHGISNHYGFVKHSLQDQISILKNRLFEPLLEKNPKMKPYVDTFINKYSQAYIQNKGNFQPLIEIKNFWADKINIQDFSKPLLSSAYVFREDSDWLKFLKSIFEKSPNFLKITHEYIQSAIHNKESLLDIPDSVYDAYFQMLKHKLGATFKKGFTPLSIKENIDSFYPTNKNTIKKKINAYLSNFPKDQSLYEHIIKELGEHIETSGTIKIFWNEKINLFPNDIAQQYNNTKTQISWGSSSSSYLYSFALNPEFIVEKSNITQNQALYFRGTFHSALSDFLTKNFNGKTLSLNGDGQYFNAGINIVFMEPSDIEKVMAFDNVLKNNIESLVSSYCKKDGNSQISDLLEEYFKKLNFAFELDKTLANKEPVKKSNRMKI